MSAKYETPRTNPKTRPNGRRFQFLGYGGHELRTARLPQLRKKRRRGHDPMLVLNMSIFNDADGWNRIFNPVKIHEDVTR